MTLGMYIFLLLAFIAANLSFIAKKLFFIIPLKNGKNVLVQLFECVVYYGVIALLACFMEYQASGSVHKQDFVFYVVTFALFVVFAFPGFVLRKFWRLKHVQ